jgi:hypothetical protein
VHRQENSDRLTDPLMTGNGTSQMADQNSQLRQTQVLQVSLLAHRLIPFRTSWRLCC